MLYDLCSVKETSKDGKTVLEVISAEHAKLLAMANEIHDPSRSKSTEPVAKSSIDKKRKGMFKCFNLNKFNTD